MLSLFGQQVYGFGARVFDISTGRVKESIADKVFAFAAQQGEKDFLGRPALVGGNDVPEARDGLGPVLKPVKAG
ncbi:hypothetical protein D9M70_554470 [compost metagenome]